jgi:hypothetical protein
MLREIADRGRRADVRQSCSSAACVALLAALLIGTSGCALTVTGGGDGSTVPGEHGVWQVGVRAMSLGGPATAMEARIQTRQPQQVADQTTNYYWVGSYLRDRSFIQVGYFLPWYSSAQAGWFYCAYTPTRQQGPCVFGDAGSVGDDGTWHTYRLRAEQPPTANAEHNTGANGLAALAETGAGRTASIATTWDVLVDGVVVGTFAWTASDTGDEVPTIYAESSGPAPHKANSTLGPVEFTDFAVRVVGRQTDELVTQGLPEYNATDICPPYGMRAGGDQALLLGSGLDCPGLLSEITWG